MRFVAGDDGIRVRRRVPVDVRDGRPRDRQQPPPPCIAANTLVPVLVFGSAERPGRRANAAFPVVAAHFDSRVNQLFHNARQHNPPRSRSWTSSFSAALQTEGRCVLALITIGRPCRGRPTHPRKRGSSLPRFRSPAPSEFSTTKDNHRAAARNDHIHQAASLISSSHGIARARIEQFDRALGHALSNGGTASQQYARWCAPLRCPRAERRRYRS